MIKTFIIDEPVMISIGLLTALFVPKGWGGSLFKTRAFWAGTYLALGFIALAAYGYLVAPDWMFMYLVPAKNIPSWLVVYALILYYFLFLAGFFVAPHLGDLHPKLPWLALLFGILASVAVILPLLPAYQVVASYEEFQRGTGIPLSESRIGKNTMLPSAWLFLSGFALLFWSRRQKSRPC